MDTITAASAEMQIARNNVFHPNDILSPIKAEKLRILKESTKNFKETTSSP